MLSAEAQPLGRGRLSVDLRPRAEAGRRAALGTRDQGIRATLLMVAGLSFCFVGQLLFLSPFQQRSAQQQAYDTLREQLAAGTAPTAAAAAGDPIAYLEVPEIGLRQVIVEGTTSANLRTGPGHRRDTVMPGLAGTSVVMGRRSTYGSPFARLDDLGKGDIIHVTMGAGIVDYKVRGVRRAGDLAPAPVASGSGRLVLATADGSPILPSGVVLVDADLTVPPLGAARPALVPGALPAAERPMAVDTGTIWRLALWLQALLVVTLAAVWAWQRWDPVKTWIAGVPVFLLVGMATADEAVKVLPNLL